MKSAEYKIGVVVLLAAFTIVNCTQRNNVDTHTYFLGYIESLPSQNSILSDTLTTAQQEVISKYHLGIEIPANFQSVVSTDDPEAFIFYNSNDNSLLLARCFENHDSTLRQIEASLKYNFIEDFEYNDLSEFKHFKSCENIVTIDEIGPLLFGGTLYDLLGAETVKHKEFTPKNKKYAFGEFIILMDDEKYLLTLSLHNGYQESFSNELDKEDTGIGRWQAFRFNTLN